MSKRINNVVIPISSHARLKTVEPYTLFESTHRYSKNDLWVEAVTGTASSDFILNEGVVNLKIGTAAGDKLIRETTRVFTYQPGKRLHIMNSFTFGGSKTNLTQRVGYYGKDNGVYLEQDGSNIYFVTRSIVSGDIVDTKVLQSSWNLDRLDGTGESSIILDMTKTQIIWINIEWLGAGTVDIGFYLNGNLITCHSFHHANINTTAYFSTASLPLRQEIFNTGTTSGDSISKQICATVISEGGYILSGRQQSIGTSLSSAITLTVANNFYPIVSLRLKSSRFDAVAVVSAMSITGDTNSIYNWEIRSGGVTSGGVWSTFEFTTGEYNISEQLEIDLTHLVAEIGAIGDTTVHQAAYGNGEIIKKGTYTTAGSATQGGNIVYDAEDDADAIFVFRCAGTMGLAASSTSTLVNGAKAANIFWLVGGALSIGATCNLKGTYIGSGAVAPGDVFTLEGRILTQAGAIGMTNATYQVPVGTPPLVLGTLITFAIFTPSGAISNTVVTHGIGDICTGEGANSGFDRIIGTLYLPSHTKFSGTEFTNASVSYNLNGSSFKGGRILASGYMRTDATINIAKDNLFKFQLERDSLSHHPYELTLVCASNGSSKSVYGSMNWEEISR